MLKAVQWLLCTYLALKFIQYFFVARPGFQAVEPGFRQKLLRGEPVVFIVACALSVPPALWSSWYFQRGYERGFERSVDCYGRLGALGHLGPVERPINALRAYKSAQMARRLALHAAEWIDIPPDSARRQLDERLNLYTRRFSDLQRQGDRPEILAQAASTERCLSEPLISF